MRPAWLVLLGFCFCVGLPRPAAAQLAAGEVHGIVHDPQHRPVPGAQVTLQALESQVVRTTQANADGEFSFPTVTLGDYIVTAKVKGFAPVSEEVTVQSGTAPILHLQLQLAAASATVSVTAAPVNTATVGSATPTTMINQRQIARTPGAALTNSLAIITDFVPGATVVHDMLHVRGGHQTMWLLDGVPVINTSIASNIAPTFDPQDLSYVEIQRGSYSAGLGDRTFGEFNAVPQSGFDSNNQGALTVTAGNFGQTNEHLSFASHTDRFAYYTSLNGNRSDLGLQTPVPQVVHDADNGEGGMASFIFNVDANDQLRSVTAIQRGYYQIPYDPFPNDIENGAIAANGFSPQYPSIGLRDAQSEWNGAFNVSWVHDFHNGFALTVSPFFNHNSADYLSAPQDTPVATTQDLSENYAGAQAALTGLFARNYFQVGTLDFAEQDHQFFGSVFNDGSGLSPIGDHENPNGNLETFFVDDKFQPFPWVSLSVGMRPTRFSTDASGGFSETSVSPRLGASVTLPWVHWTARAFYGHFYQEPPLESVSGPALLDFAQGQGLGFVPLHGERDTEFQYGLTIPWRGWVLDTDAFRTHAHNYLDHNNIGDSSIFFPITVSQALIRAWEMTLRSPRFANIGQFHLAFSNQIAEATGTITGGLTDFSFGPGYSPLDHDQRDTLNLGGDLTLPWHAYASANVYYGSGFSNGFPGAPYPGDYLPSDTRIDLAAGKSFGERLSASINVLNLTNKQAELDNSLTFGGFHWDYPRQIYAALTWRFKY